MVKRAYDAIDVANYIVNYCIDNNDPVSNLKLQKVLYYVQAASLVEHDDIMFRDDICAWKYGPVVESVYHNFKWFVDKAIDEKVTGKYDFFENEDDDSYNPEEIIMESDRNLIQKVITSYKSYSALSMVKKTHNEAPWKNAYANNEEYIKVTEIKKFYSTTENRGLIYG